MRRGAQWDGGTVGQASNGTWIQWDKLAMGCGNSGTGQQRDVGTVGQTRNRTWEQWDRLAIGCGNSGTG